MGCGGDVSQVNCALLCLHMSPGIRLCEYPPLFALQGSGDSFNGLLPCL